MKRKISILLILIFVISIPAFATSTKNIKSDKKNTTVQSKVQVKTAEFEGTITEVTKDRLIVSKNNKKLTYSEIAFNLSKTTKYENCKVTDLKVGATVKIKHSLAMTRSLPPQTSAYSIRLVKAAAQTFSYKGKITELIAGKDGKMVTVTAGAYADGTKGTFAEITFVVTRNTTLQDCTVDDLTLGAIVEATYGLTMTRSLPPQTAAFSVKVIKPGEQTFEYEGSIKEVSDVKDYKYVTVTAIDSKNTNSEIVFIVSKDTKLENCTLQDMIVGAKIKVTYGMAMTASLPPQTSAFKISIEKQLKKIK